LNRELLSAIAGDGFCRPAANERGDKQHGNDASKITHGAQGVLGAANAGNNLLAKLLNDLVRPHK